MGQSSSVPSTLSAFFLKTEPLYFQGPQCLLFQKAFPPSRDTPDFLKTPLFSALHKTPRHHRHRKTPRPYRRDFELPLSLRLTKGECSPPSDLAYLVPLSATPPYQSKFTPQITPIVDNRCPCMASGVLALATVDLTYDFMNILTVCHLRTLVCV
ncbi:hypothetical protein L211DRAFT_854524 [Terfezia boudieri ATCC MYA-4762]|uniref:Uncharacterized protein n=1 Tax=Terfezia boudieri ATCC MYA-4762 TaxID=1051890 RepID=A0A3N4LJE8_9PEZI|nr:hypothetical protein L211DRAFT_854524 [Terfezia boudieri ATCC MYA-4762]